MHLTPIPSVNAQPVHPAGAPAARPGCPRCASHRGVIGHGRGRFLCKPCGKTFSHQTLVEITARQAQLRIVTADLGSDDPSTCRELAKHLRVSPQTANRYRHKVMATFPEPDPAVLTALREAAVLLRHENRKGARRGTDAPRGQDAVLVAITGNGRPALTRLPEAERRVATGVGPAPQKRMIRLTPDNGTVSVCVRTRSGAWRSLDLGEFWQDWFVGNRGPASKNLDLYLRWFAHWLTR